MKSSFLTVMVGWVAVLTCSTGLWAKDESYAKYVALLRKQLPTDGVVLFDGADLTAFPVTQDKTLSTHEIVPVHGQEFGEALRVQILKRADPVWSVQLGSPANRQPIRKGDLLFLVFNVRCLAGGDETGTGIYGAYVQLNRAPWTGLMGVDGTADRSWKRMYTYGVTERDYAAGEAALAIHLAQQAQTLEFGGFLLVNLGPGVDPAKLPFTRITYPGREKDAPWRKRAQERIERYRKGDLTVSVVDQAGKPVAGAQVHVQMTRHAFGFGSFIESLVLANTPDARKYREWILKLFNRATTPIYWADWGWANENIRREYHGIARWLKENGITTRGHVIVYPGWEFLPAAVRKLEKDPAVLRQRILDHIKEVVQATNPYGFDEYDVTNELRSLHDLTDILGYPAVAEWFQTTRQYNSTARLALNENSLFENGGQTQVQQDHFAKMIQLLTDAKAGPDVLGMQGHFSSALTAPGKLVEVFDRFAKFGKPIHITEFDLDIRDEACQGDYMRDFMTVAFSHPAIEAFTQWGFWEGRHWRPQGALIRKDWTFKPNGQAYMDLVFKEWWTDVQGKTGIDGVYITRGFLGDYLITVSANGKKKTVRAALPREGVKISVVLE